MQPKKLFYIQAFKSNVNDIIKIKNIFLKLPANKILEIHKVMNNPSQKAKPKLNMITKNLSRKQVIVPMESNNTKRVMAKTDTRVFNINRLFKEVKSEISINLIYSNNKRLLITTNKVAAISNLNIIKKYMKDINDVDSSDIISSKLS